MMKRQTWVLISLASVLLIFCAVRAVRSPAVSAGAQRTGVCEDLARSDEKETSAGADNSNAANELRLRQLETAGAAQRMRQQEAANELQRRQQQAPRPLS